MVQNNRSYEESHRSQTDDPLDLSETDDRADRMRDAVDGWLADLTSATGEARAPSTGDLYATYDMDIATTALLFFSDRSLCLPHDQGL